MASLFIHDKDPLNRTDELDSKDKLETKGNDYVTFEEYFGSSDNELNESFYGFEEEYEVLDEDSTDNSGEKLETALVVYRSYRCYRYF